MGEDDFRVLSSLWERIEWKCWLLYKLWSVNEQRECLLFVLLSLNALQGLTDVNKAVNVCGRFCLQLVACMFTLVSPW